MKAFVPPALPTKEISYNYTVAMFMAQQLEDGLRRILDAADYYGLIEELELSDKQKKKFKDSTEWLENETCGRLLPLLRSRINLKEEAWKLLETAIKDRNFLAHRFLLQFDYAGITKGKERKVVELLEQKALIMITATRVVRQIAASLDKKTDEIDSHSAKLLGELGVELDVPRKKALR